jgi:uroporphyrinogen III methyltransferase/synthase
MPLDGRRIVVTRALEQAGALSRPLAALGAEVLELPTIRIEDPPDRRSFAGTVVHAHEYDWIVFTSANGARRFFDAFFKARDDARALGKPRIAVIGEGTAEVVREFRYAVDLMPERSVGEGLVEAFAKLSIENLTVLWVKAEKTRRVVGEGLEALGAIVDECIAYRTVPETSDPTGAAGRFRKEGADIVVFTSASTVVHFFALDLALPEGCVAASIGPVTSDMLREQGVTPAIEAEKHDIDGLVAAIQGHFAGK